MSELERIKKLVSEEPRDLLKIEQSLVENSFTKEELMSIAIRSVSTYEDIEGCEEYYEGTNRSINEDEYIDDRGRYYKVSKEYSPEYMKRIDEHPLIKILEMLLQNGLDPNTCLSGEEYNVLDELRYVSLPYLGAAAMRLLFKHGASPYVSSDSGEIAFEELDGFVAIDVSLVPYDILQTTVQCWLVMIGYGGRPEKAEPFKLNPDHSYDELKEFEFFDYVIIRDKEKRKTLMHITDIRTGEEIGTL